MSLESFERAQELLATAERLESSGELKKALDTYVSGLQLMLEFKKVAPTEQARRTALNIAATYMTKAENLKARLRAQGLLPVPSPAAAPASSPAPSSASSSSSSSAERRRLIPQAEPPVWVERKPKRKQPPVTVGASSSTQEKKATAAAPSNNSGAGYVDPALRRQIESEILSRDTGVNFSKVVGMDKLKQTLTEMITLPILRPDLFSGIRKPPTGLLMFGPPGNGKTFIAKAVANEAKCTFFSISAASLMSRNFGDSEKLVRALFAVARERAPSIIFIDELDSLLSKRSADEHEASRRVKTEFLVQLDGVGSDESKHVVVIGATNLPHQLDDAVLRRLPKRIYVPHPDQASRRALVEKMMEGQKHALTERDFRWIVEQTDGYSASDIRAVCQEAAMGPIREFSPSVLASTPVDAIPPIALRHFQAAIKAIRPSVSPERLAEYEAYAKQQDALRAG